MSEDEKRPDEETEVEGHTGSKFKAADEPSSEGEEPDEVEAHTGTKFK